jgi:hypothetical protein
MGLDLQQSTSHARFGSGIIMSPAQERFEPMQSAPSRRAVLTATLLVFAGPAWAAQSKNVCAKDMTRPPDPKPGETLADVLMPGGKPVGQAAGAAQTRDLPGQDTAAKNLFERITAGATDVTPKDFQGLVRKLPNGQTVTFRYPTRSGGVPTIELNVPGIAVRRVRFPENCRNEGGGEAELGRRRVS